MRTLVTDPFADDAIGFLEWAFGPKAKAAFVECAAVMTQRAGQAFMNVLFEFDRESYDRLVLSANDPFYNDTKIPKALDIITSK